MQMYRYPSKADEVTFCHQDPVPQSCKKERHIVPSNSPTVEIDPFAQGVIKATHKFTADKWSKIVGLFGFDYVRGKEIILDEVVDRHFIKRRFTG